MSEDRRIEPDPGANTVAPLPGEPGIPNVAAAPRTAWSKKGLLAVALLLASLIAILGLTVQRVVASGKKSSDTESRLVRDRPTAASAEPRKLDLPPSPGATSVATASSPRIPALVPTEDEVAEPIGVRRAGTGAPGSSGARTVLPEDAPILLVSSRLAGRGSARAAAGTEPEEHEADASSATDPLAATARNLQGFQRQLEGLLDNLTRTAAAAGVQGEAEAPTSALLGNAPQAQPSAAPGPGLFGGQLQGSATPRVVADLIGNRSLTLPKGTAFTCALKTRVISATSGLIGCQVQRNVFSDDGRVLLIERGSHLDGEYRIGSVRPGMVRIPVLWTRIRTPLGVTIAIESPGTGPLGESGIDGYVDNRWTERIGAAMLLSLIDDTVKLVIQNQTQDSRADTIVLPSTTANTSKLAEKVLDSTINIPPLIYQNQGGIVGIVVARDVDFSAVYELRPVAEAKR